MERGITRQQFRDKFAVFGEIIDVRIFVEEKYVALVLPQYSCDIIVFCVVGETTDSSYIVMPVMHFKH